MSYIHKFQEHNFNNGYQTHNSILDTVPYLPEVIFIGTYNHGWNWNPSDFYYGRGMYMWTVMSNLFTYKANHLVACRNFNNNVPNANEIFEICSKAKIVFADIVKGINPEIPTVELPDQETVLVDDSYHWRGYKDKPLDFMGSEGWLDDNVKSIVKFINATPSIKRIYFTFKSGVWLVDKLEQICNAIRPDVSYCSVFTPTANGFGKNLEMPYNHRAWSLAHCWLWNGLPHQNYIVKPGYGHLDHDWLIGKGVNPNNF